MFLEILLAQAAMTPTPCAIRKSPAMVRVQATPSLEIIRKIGMYHAIVIVDVGLDPDGKITTINISQSSGNNALDADALAIAAHSTYSPRVENCVSYPALVTVPNREASVVNFVAANPPPELKAPVTVLVEVTIGPSGNLVDARIYKSGGSIAVDRAAIEAAPQTTYSPKVVDCVPTTGDYLFRSELWP